MLEMNPEIVCDVIARSREFHAKEEVVIPEEPGNPGDDWAMQILADHADDLTYLDLKTQIDDLDPEQQVQLVALMWLGRGDYEADEWDMAVEDAKDNWTPTTAEYLIATPLVSDYLTEGLALLGYSCED
ncbi:hypothetical protein B1C78_06015 [Thioalkalivibrio denitrificans]|uniref:DUF3775 domain-containing protein n=1 Tax=Thioalkalivibrio denitrificans TaxID=108003 RepID=A0A1V3NKS7_9GAMM|nr:DUF3775 domain-containing protein [Thioalkalivibrio denitrificans]OOG25660.1 hypothetical protein B1C78_06015 [Thioalkalivibrio denitrificans]